MTHTPLLSEINRPDSRMLRSISSGNFQILSSRLDTSYSKQQKDLERWQRKLSNAQAESARKVEKTLNLERIIEEKGQNVMEMHRKRQEQAR